MKKILIYGLLIVVFFVVIKYYIKYRDLSKLRFQNVKFDFDTKNQGIKTMLSSLVSTSIPVKISIDIQNMSNSTYELNNANLTVYNSKGVVVATPTAPIKNSIKIPAKKTVTVPLDYELKTSGIIQLCRELNLTPQTADKGIAWILARWVLEGELGIDLYLSGYVNAEGFTKIDIPINNLKVRV